MNFVALFQMLDTSQSTTAKRQALCEFFTKADSLESALAIQLLAGKTRTKWIKHSILRDAVKKIYATQYWLFEDCYALVGDLSETLAILFANLTRESEVTQPVLESWYAEQKLLASGDPETIPSAILQSLSRKTRDEAFLFLKLSTGGFRIGVSQGIIHDALARVTGIDRSVIDERMMGNFNVEANWLEALKRPITEEEKTARPVPFLLASPLSDKDKIELNPTELVVEYKWDGIRSQLIKTNNIIRLWSRGDQDITQQFPDIIRHASALPSGIILDGEILIERDNQLGTFQDLQTRLNRKRLTHQLLSSHPAVFRPYDVIRWNYEDIRKEPLIRRRKYLAKIDMKSSDVYIPQTFDEIECFRASAREHRAEGVMLKHQNGTYESGRKIGLWWKWKLDPMTADCVLVYAKAGRGRRAALHTDYTLAVWSENDELVPVAKAYSGLTDRELKSVDQWIRRNTTDKFGPVRQVKPQLIFEIGFEGIARSSRHKSGIALRFPRILRWRHDVNLRDVDNLSHFKTLLDLVM